MSRLDGLDAGADFAERLRRLRVAAGLTQEALSERSGISVNAIAALENGRRRQPRRETVRMLAEGLGLHADARELLTAPARGRGTPQAAGGQSRSARPPEPGAGVPPRAVLHFVGREPELASLRQRLQRGRRVSVHGMGGVGKTQLLVRYIDQHRATYLDGLFWVRADRESTLLRDLASLAWHLGLPEREEREQGRQVEAVLRWLRGRAGWLVVLDNVESTVAHAVDRWLPPDLLGHVAVTSRTPVWPGALALEPLPLPLATRFLLDRADRDDAEAAALVAETLGCLPLALEQAAAYLQASGRDLASYAGLLRRRLVELMGEGQPAGYPFTVATTWRPSFQRVELERPAAAALLRLCAFLSPDDIPVVLLQSGAAELPEDLRSALADDVELDRLVTALQRHSLGERQGDRLRLHRLVQAVVRESLAPQLRLAWLGAAVCLLVAALRPDAAEHPERWSFYGRLVPHVQAVAGFAAEQDLESAPLATLLLNTAMYLVVRGESRLGELLAEGSLAIRERELGPDHPDTADSMGVLGGILMERGRLDVARPLLERSLAIRERVLDPEHRDLAESLNNLGWLMLEQGELDAAGALHERALHVWECGLGPGHPQTAVSLNNVGHVRMLQGRLEVAAELHRRALAIREAAFGSDHPHTLNSLSNLAAVLQRQGHLDTAQLLHERVLSTREQVLGPDHPHTVRALHRLAALRRDQGNLPAARALLDRAVATMERTHGTDHRLAVEGRQARAQLDTT